jgi:hypothetical protein
VVPPGGPLLRRHLLIKWGFKKRDKKMEFLRVTKEMKVRTRDIFYIRKVRESEALALDRDGAIKAPRNVAIIVLKGADSARIVTPVAFDTLKERMAFVDIGENRFVPASNIEAIELSADEGYGQRFCSVWMFGGSVLTSLIPLYILEGRHKDGALVQQRMDEQEDSAQRVKQRLLERPKFAPVIPRYTFPFPESGFGVAA